MTRRASILSTFALLFACDAEPEPAGSRKAPPAKTADAGKSAPTAATPPQPPTSPEHSIEVVKDPAPIADTAPHPFGILDMLAMDRLSDPQFDGRPDGKGSLVFVRRVTDLVANKGRTDLWRVPLTGGEPTRLTDHIDADDSPRIAPDGTIYFVSARSGDPQVWKLPPGGGEPVQVTTLPLPVGSLALSPDGKTLAFAVDVFVDCAPKDTTAPSVLDCTKSRLGEIEASPATGVLYERMFVRH